MSEETVEHKATDTTTLMYMWYLLITKIKCCQNYLTSIKESVNQFNTKYKHFLKIEVLKLLQYRCLRHTSQCQLLLPSSVISHNCSDSATFCYQLKTYIHNKGNSTYNCLPKHISIEKETLALSCIRISLSFLRLTFDNTCCCKTTGVIWKYILICIYNHA